MRTLTATEASRTFSNLLDAIECGETVTITPAVHPVAEIGPARRRSGADLRAALADVAPPETVFADTVRATASLLTAQESNPWADVCSRYQRPHHI
ncbi:MAG: prevent-host-death protein [Acidimicrobiales bacterium]|nr:MAG: prevent-host-death protein [Acidimicrobiales bacterium]